MAEFANARNERHADHPVLFLYNRIKHLQSIQKCPTVLFGDVVQDRFVIFVKEENTWRTQKQESNHREWRQHPQAVYHCPGCGATVTVDENEALTQCVFCGSSIVRSEFNDQALLPEAVIPFKLTLDEAKHGASLP